MKPLTDKRLNQLKLLLDRGAISKETAFPASLHGSAGFAPHTLAAMQDDGLTAAAHMRVNGDPRRRASHYWLTAKGQAAAKGVAA